MPANKHKGTTLDSFLDEEKIHEDVEAVAIKRVIAYQLKKAMKRKHVTKSKMAKKIGTSRSGLDRLLDPKNTSVTLNSLVKAVHFIGKKLHISFG